MVVDITKQMERVFKEFKELSLRTIAIGVEYAEIHDDGEIEVVITFGFRKEDVIGRRYYRFLPNGFMQHSDKIEALKKNS